MTIDEIDETMTDAMTMEEGIKPFISQEFFPNSCHHASCEAETSSSFTRKFFTI